MEYMILSSSIYPVRVHVFPGTMPSIYPLSLCVSSRKEGDSGDVDSYGIQTEMVYHYIRGDWEDSRAAL
jgi:hypothetical protein